MGLWSTAEAAQTGMASYYKHGKRTANGERFNPHGYTAAHRTLPFGTRVLVTNLKNGKSVIVRINDRGPFTKGRVIDLSLGAAKVVGLTRPASPRSRSSRSTERANWSRPGPLLRTDAMAMLHAAITQMASENDWAKNCDKAESAGARGGGARAHSSCCCRSCSTATISASSSMRISLAGRRRSTATGR